ncbi:MAG: type III secretion system stator protein SctL, partial [Mailhella sp.]|nr:type III secretion system stator protein SctL [Mailhella sp.]
IESTLVSVVTQAIRKIIGDMDDKERIVSIVRNALGVVRGQQKVTVRVAPADEPAVSEALAAMTSAASGSAFLTVVADARLERDSCILESELGVVDASLSTQLRALENAFHSKIHQQ